MSVSLTLVRAAARTRNRLTSIPVLSSLHELESDQATITIFDSGTLSAHDSLHLHKAGETPLTEHPNLTILSSNHDHMSDQVAFPTSEVVDSNLGGLAVDSNSGGIAVDNI